MKIDRIILCCDNRSHYVQCLRLARHAWYVEFGIEPDVLWLDFDGGGDRVPPGVTVVDCRAIDTTRLPPGNAAQTVRMYAAATSADPDTVVMLGDIDMLPLNTAAYRAAIADFAAAEGLLSWGANAYDDTPDAGKFQMNYLCGAARHFRRCVEFAAPVHDDYARWFLAMAERVHTDPTWPAVDAKEDPYLPFGTYADESLLRCLMVRTGTQHVTVPRRTVPASKVRTGCVRPYIDRLDRSQAHGGEVISYAPIKGDFATAVAQGQIVDCHVVRPFRTAVEQGLYDFLLAWYGLDRDFLLRS